MSVHKAISKKKRMQVYKKYGGHCAYCGCELEYKDMQVDHIKSLYIHSDRRSDMDWNAINDVGNLMPSCRQCNFYKNTGDIEYLRKRLADDLVRNLRKPFDYRLAIKYGLVEEHIHPIVFYFEKQ